MLDGLHILHGRGRGPAPARVPEASLIFLGLSQDRAMGFHLSFSHTSTLQVASTLSLHHHPCLKSTVSVVTSHHPPSPLFHNTQ